jgi:glutamate racemase
MNRQPIGVFDSGIGGLTILRSLIRSLPHEDVIYFGDTARVPYGTKSKDTVLKFSIENVELLLRHHVKLIVVACHTSSAWTLETLRQYFRVPIVGVVTPGATAAMAATHNGRIGVLGTASTIRSKAYERALRRLDRSVSVVSQSCPLLVSLAEEGWTKDAICRSVVQKYVAPVLKQRVDTLLLGCTHYPLLAPMIRRVAGRSVRVVDAGRQTARAVTEILADQGLIHQYHRRGRMTFYVSDEPERFVQVGTTFLGQRIRNVHRVSM